MNAEQIIKEKQGTIVDVRTPVEYMGGNVTGSINIPLQEIQQRMEEIKNLNSDEIIGKVFSQTRCIDWDKVFGDNDLRSDVSIESCNKIRDAGTKFFQNNQLSESLDLYNSYIRSCHRLRENGEIKNQLIFQGLLMITLTNV